MFRDGKGEIKYDGKYCIVEDLIHTCALHGEMLNSLATGLYIMKLNSPFFVPIVFHQHLKE